MQQTAYFIRSIRMINFHNFTDETIHIEGGGHLFLLGDNGCGKTTILDAVHYVLTAGQSMEWNSAARISGAKRDGRRVQGIILRYNLDTGVINTKGAISYVALEITGRNGKPLTIGMGMSATAMDEKIRFWGIIRECPLSDVPFLTRENGRLRPASRLEFKETLGSGSGFISSRKNYRQDIANRLFGGEDSYQDICRFLAMGKAYREISAGAADYHALFKRLLPEPRTAIFVQIIEALRTLDESQSILDDLDRKLFWLHQLQAIVGTISEQRQAMQRYDWLLCRFRINKITGEQESIQHRIQTGKEQLLQNKSERVSLERLDRDFEERLDTLKAKDTSGLVIQEKRIQLDITTEKAAFNQGKEKLNSEHSKWQHGDKQCIEQQKLFLKKLTSFIPALVKQAIKLPFSITTLQNELDLVSRNKDYALFSSVDIQECIKQSDRHLESCHQDLTRLVDREQNLLESIALQEQNLEEREKQSEIYPDLPHYQECLRTMQQNMLSPRPLYLGLEWLPTVKLKVQEYIEECIGEEILATLFFRENEYEQARKIGAHHPGQRISCEKHTTETIPDWMRPVFDFQDSDPECLRCLATEMESDGLQPQVTLVDGEAFLAFRSHERALFGRPPRLIGGEGRKRALAADIRSIKNELKSLNHDKRELSRSIKRTMGQQEDLNNFKVFLQEQIRELRGISSKVKELTQQQEYQQERLQAQQEKTDSHKRTLESLILRQKELNERIAGEGLANLERRMNTLRNKKAANQTQIRELNQKIGGDERELAQLQEKTAQLAITLSQSQQQKEETERKLRAILPDVADIAHYVLRSKKGQQFKTSEAIEKERNNSDVVARTGENQLRDKVNDPEFGGGFRFHYESDTNELRDFRQQDLPSIIQQQSDALTEQKDVINDRTRKLFKQIIMTDLLDYLREHVGELDQMIRRINTRLGQRSFGGQRYRFRLRPLNQYKRLITIIKQISSFDPLAEKELETFFSDNREAIISTEAGSIPEELDYRNWYKYELEVSTIGEKGVVMDRRTKSIGSGGEQAVPNYLLILTIAHFLFQRKKIRLHALLFDEAFYGIDAGRRDQLLGFATDLDLQLFIASPDQDGVRQEVGHSTTLLVKKDSDFNVHLYPFHWQNPAQQQMDLFKQSSAETPVAFDEEL
jgi:energy-coupling factor transporter ATP-binding protein EcfA2